jgi:hypothetical protein
MPADHITGDPVFPVKHNCPLRPIALTGCDQAALGQQHAGQEGPASALAALAPGRAPDRVTPGPAPARHARGLTVAAAAGIGIAILIMIAASLVRGAWMRPPMAMPAAGPPWEMAIRHVPADVVTCGLWLAALLGAGGVAAGLLAIHRGARVSARVLLVAGLITVAVLTLLPPPVPRMRWTTRPTAGCWPSATARTSPPPRNCATCTRPVSYCHAEDGPLPAAPSKSSLNTVDQPDRGPGTAAGAAAAANRAPAEDAPAAAVAGAAAGSRAMMGAPTAAATASRRPRRRVAFIVARYARRTCRRKPRASLSYRGNPSCLARELSRPGGRRGPRAGRTR